MIILRLTPLLLCLCIFQLADAQYILSRVTFPIDDQQSIHTLAKAGIDLTHGSHSVRNAFTTDLQEYELARLDKAGIRYTVVIPDLNVHRQQAKANHRGGSFLSCQDHHFDENVPLNFELGYYGGFMSMSEVLDNLDLMAFYYPNLITERKPIGSFKTYNNNSIFVVKISDNVDTDEEEPEILYTGLHHARELISTSELIYYMWYLLENYNKNPMIKEIVDHTELYFVPVLNPDGMQYNIEGYDEENDEFTRNVRKNLRDNDLDGAFNPEIDGVDLNRNYGYHWAYDDEGSSGYEGSDNYRGPSPFSEPETKAIQYLCGQRTFQLALNAHSYGDLLIYPWGYNNTVTQDSAIFTNYGELLSKQNGFIYGLGLETVGYMTNGDSDDWMYGEKDILSLTPEIGDDEDGFYPLKEDIIPLCQSTLEMNILAARLVNSVVQITDESPEYIKLGVNSLDLEFTRYGLLNTPVVVSFNSLSPHILQVPAPTQLDLNKFEPHLSNLSFTVDNQLNYGSSVKLEIVCRQGNYSFRDTLTKTRADFNSIFTDNGDDLTQWDNNSGQLWDTTEQSYKTGPVSITDSPNGVYLPNSQEALILGQPIDLTNITSAYAQFWAKWDIEDHYDYVVFQASTDGTNWENLCGEQSKLGSIFQLYEEPLYDGKQARWVFETTDLSTYVGHHIQLRFFLFSDGFVARDGFYFDDFKVITVDENNVATEQVLSSGIQVYPNPAHESFNVSIPDLQNATLRVFNNLGEPVYQSSVVAKQVHKVDAAQWPAGLYYYRIEADHKLVNSGSVSLMQ